MKREEKTKLTRVERIQQLRDGLVSFLYQKDEDGRAVVMGRTRSSWGKISLFFFVYYACLTGFFAAMFAIAFTTMPEIKDGPKYTSLIEDKPVLRVYPEGGVGSYKTTDLNGTIESYNSFLKAYEEQYWPCYDNISCKAGDNYRPEEKTKQCYFEVSTLGPCRPVRGAHYGFNNRTPCLYFWLSKIYNWKPVPSNSSNNFIELDCSVYRGPEDSTDIKYYPERTKAFPISFWPFRGESHFMTPIAAITVNSTEDVKIRCKAVAKNIELSDTWKHKRGATGKVEFSVSKAEE